MTRLNLALDKAYLLCWYELKPFLKSMTKTQADKKYGDETLPLILSIRHMYINSYLKQFTKSSCCSRNAQINTSVPGTSLRR